MCRRCEEIERQLKDCRRTYASTDDELALTLLAVAIDDLEAEKASLHPTDKEGS